MFTNICIPFLYSQASLHLSAGKHHHFLMDGNEQLGYSDFWVTNGNDQACSLPISNPS